MNIPFLVISYIQIAAIIYTVNFLDLDYSTLLIAGDTVLYYEIIVVRASLPV
jgi:hypothetical protein